jgi:NAD(P)-dependent dehydrogenase (short-subunit alcohol dehydrogenase family)
MAVQDQLAIVTGASSGMGRETAKLLAQRGWHVLAGVRKAADGESLAADNIEPVILDITDQNQIDAVLARVDEDPSRRPLSVLVNNAGISLNAPIETLSLENWRQQFDVNLFGHVAMTKTLLPALMASQGRVVNVSSIGGLVALPTYGPYAASKFAMEAFSDVLRREVGRFGVTVIVIEPGTIATDIWDKQSAAMQELSAAWTPDLHARYDSLQEAVITMAQGANERGLDATDAAQVIVEAITAETPQTRYLIGDAVATGQTVHDLSDRKLDEMIAGIFG